MTVDSRSFRGALSCFASGVTVVAAIAADGQPVGVTVSAFSSLSLDPPLVLVCLDRRTYALDAYRSGPFTVNILHENQKEISVRFSSRDEARWAKTLYHAGANGRPIIDGCLASVECDVESVQEGGDHVILIGRVTQAHSSAEGAPLVYFRSDYARIGK